MHAQNIIQDLLQTECDSIHAKRRLTLALMVQASCIGTLSLMGLSRRLNATTLLRHLGGVCRSIAARAGQANVAHDGHCADQHRQSQVAAST